MYKSKIRESSEVFLHQKYFIFNGSKNQISWKEEKSDGRNRT